MYNNSYFGGNQFGVPSFNPNFLYQQPKQEPTTEVLYGTLEEAKAYKVSPLKAVVFINKDKSELYIKSADNIGSSSFQGYKLTTLEEPTETNSQYVTQKEFEELKNKFEEISKKLEV